MTPTKAYANAESLRIKALALYAEAKDIRRGDIWFDSVLEAQQAKLAEARAADDAYNAAIFLAMRLETEERRRKSRAA